MDWVTKSSTQPTTFTLSLVYTRTQKNSLSFLEVTTCCTNWALKIKLNKTRTERQWEAKNKENPYDRGLEKV